MCPRCKAPRSKVLKTENQASATLRVRVCCRCGLEFKTYEVSEADWKLARGVAALFEARKRGLGADNAPP